MNYIKIYIYEYSENFPNSEKVYVEGSKPNIKVPSRMIKQTSTKINNTFQENEPIYVYDTTGPYTDPKYDIANGTSWISTVNHFRQEDEWHLPHHGKK